MVTNAHGTVGNRLSICVSRNSDGLLLDSVRRWESRPHNQPLSDKTWVEKLLNDAHRHFAAAIRVR